MRKYSNVLFLDFDGVLVNRESLLKQSGIKAKAHPACVSALNRVLEETGAYVVISSTWRMMGLLTCKDFLHEWGVKANVIGMTPRGYDDPRGVEIAAWLSENQEELGVENFAIVDDDSDMAHLMPHLVKTSFEVGLTEADADKLIERLRSRR